MNFILATLSAIIIALSISFTNELLLVIFIVPLLFFLRKKPKKTAIVQQTGTSRVHFLNLILISVFLFSLIGMLYSDIIARTGNTIPYFQSNLSFGYYIFNFIAIITTTIMALSKFGLKSKLIIISLYSVISHLFRYIIYVVIWNSDVWNNLQVAWWIHDGGVLTTQPNLYYTLARADNAYVSLWGINVSISKITGIDLFTLYPYVGILLSLFVPLIIYQIVKLLVNNDTYAIVGALMCTFLWDAFYWLSFSLANGLGILGLLFSLLFWILYLKGKVSIFLPLLVTVAGILAYPLTGIFVAVIATFSILSKRIGIRKSAIIVGLLSCAALPVYDLYTRVTYFAVSGVNLPTVNYLPFDVASAKFIFPSQRSLDLYGFNLSSLLDLPYLVIYILVAFGLILGRKQVKISVYYLLLTLLVGALFSQFYAVWSQSRTYERIGTTILPWLFIILAPLSFKWVYENLKEMIPHLSFKLGIGQKFKKSYSLAPKRVFAIGLCIIIGISSTANFILSPTTNTYNANIDQVNAVNYIIQQDPSRQSLVLADSYTLFLLISYAHGNWYNYTHGDRLFSNVMAPTLPAYYQVLSDPSSVKSGVLNGKNVLTKLLQKDNVEKPVYKFFFIYDPMMIKYQFLSAAQNITETLSSIIGQPKMFGDVAVYSGVIPTQISNGWMTQLSDTQAVYDLTFNDMKSVLSNSVVKGQVIFDGQWGGLLALPPNSSLTMKVGIDRQIVNASLSYSIYQYEESDNNSVLTSVDGINWITVWKPNVTGVYVDVTDLNLPPILNGHNSFYLKFLSDNAVNKTSIYSMAIRTLWANDQTGIKLKIFGID